jgi:outer membrane protein insertion porin family
VPCNFSYNPQAIGTGIRYKTPVGPVRFDLGYNFNPTRYPIHCAVFVGTTCTQPQYKVETLRHINVFFSIGQTF